MVVDGGLVSEIYLTLLSPWTVARQTPDNRIFQERALEWVATSFSRQTFQTQGWNLGLLYCRQILY